VGRQQGHIPRAGLARMRGNGLRAPVRDRGPRLPTRRPRCSVGRTAGGRGMFCAACNNPQGLGQPACCPSRGGVRLAGARAPRSTRSGVRNPPERVFERGLCRCCEPVERTLNEFGRFRRSDLVQLPRSNLVQPRSTHPSTEDRGPKPRSSGPKPLNDPRSPRMSEYAERPPTEAEGRLRESDPATRRPPRPGAPRAPTTCRAWSPAPS
jgi:hypothetical protein